MRAVQISRFGPPDVLGIVEIPTPVPGPSQVLVRVHAAGVNFAETLMRENRYALTPELPAVLGTEVVGTIERLGNRVDGLAAGARVAAPLFAAGTYLGGYAEYVLIDASLVAPLPDALSYEDATALMVQGLTALYLTTQAAPKNRAVLVNAAGGGVGTLLVQLAKRAGAKTVIAGASTTQKLDLARSLGADAGVDYTQSDWVEQARAASGGAGLDIIYESVGGAVTRASLNALAPLGRLFVFGALNVLEFQLGVPELKQLIFQNQSLTGFALLPLLAPETLQTSLAELFDLAVRGQLKVTVGGVYPLERAAEAHRALQTRSTTGKVVLVP